MALAAVNLGFFGFEDCRDDQLEPFAISQRG
jgi:hypothetical protein